MQISTHHHTGCHPPAARSVRPVLVRGLTTPEMLSASRAPEKAGFNELPMPSRVRVIDPDALIPLSGDALPQRPN